MRHIARLLGSTAVLWEGEGGGGGAGGDGGGGGAWTPPKDLPAEFAGKDANETLTKLLPAFTETRTRADGLRTQLAQLPKAPEKPELYTFKPGDNLKPFFGEDPSKNPALQHARAAFHKAGVPDAAFQQIIEETYTPMLEAGLIVPPYDPKAELQTLMSQHGLDQTTASARVNEATGFAKGLAGQLNQKVPQALQKDVAAALEALTDTAAGVTLLTVLKGRLAESGFRVPDDSTGTYAGELTDQDLDRLTADPRIDPRNTNHQDPQKRFDPALRQRYDAGMATRGQKKYAGKA